MSIDLSLASKLSKDIKKSLTTVGKEETRFLVDTFYQIQSYRISTAAQIRAIEQDADKAPDKTHECLSWYLEQIQLLEKELEKALKVCASSTHAGRWAQSIVGIGPIISACLISSLDITKAPSAGHFWSYCGLNDNNRPWISRENAERIVNEIIGKSSAITDDHLIAISEKTKWSFSYLEKKCTDEDGIRHKDKLRSAISVPPYNIELKKLCWKIGESFMKQSGRNSKYGQLYKDRKAYETIKNNNGDYAEQAEAILRSKNFSKNTVTRKALESGKLSDAHINERAKRYAVKIFISHLFECMYIDYYHKPAPNPYVFDYLGHVEYIAPEVPYDQVK